MKRLLALIFSAIMVISLAACSANNKSGSENNNTPNSQAESKTDDASSSKAASSASNGSLVNSSGEEFNGDITVKNNVVANAEPITSNKVTFYGKEYAFPIKVSELLADGWILPNNNSFEDSFEPKKETSLISFSLLSEDRTKSISMRSVYNGSDEKKPIAECLLTSAGISSITKEGDQNMIILPGGINPQSAPGDVIDVYGKPGETTKFKTSTNGKRSLSYSEQTESGFSFVITFKEDTPNSVYSIEFTCPAK